MKNRPGLALNIIQKASVYLKHEFGQIVSGKEKSYLDKVSKADKAVNHLMTSLIREHFPSDGILSEEAKERKGKSGFRWVFDPLEGTHNFLAGLWEWGCSVALENTDLNIILFGLCCFPMHNELFTARRGFGAFCNNKEIHVSLAEKLHGQMFYCDSAYRLAPQKILQDIKMFCDAGCRLRSTGSFQFNMARLALGQAGVVTNRTPKPWDVAAVSLIIEEAGGKITDEKNNFWNLTSPNILATNGLTHSQALKLFQKGGM